MIIVSFTFKTKMNEWTNTAKLCLRHFYDSFFSVLRQLFFPLMFKTQEFNIINICDAKIVQKVCFHSFPLGAFYFTHIWKIGAGGTFINELLKCFTIINVNVYLVFAWKSIREFGGGNMKNIIDVFCAQMTIIIFSVTFNAKQIIIYIRFYLLL